MQYPTLFVLALLCAVPTVRDVQAAPSPECKRLFKTIQQLGVQQRAARNPLASASKVSRAEGKVEKLLGAARRNADACDWSARLHGIPELQPLADAGRQLGAKAFGRAVIHVEVGIRSLLPDDNVCHVAIRTGKASRKSDRCFKAQDDGVTRPNLTRLAKGWCRRAKAGRTSRAASIELNKLARLFESADLPSHVASQIVEHWEAMYCPGVE